MSDIEEARALSSGVAPLLVLGKIRAILDAFSLAAPALTLGELRARTEMPASTLQRLVANLVSERFLDREGDRYRIGVRMGYWAAAAARRLDLVEVVAPVLRRLRDDTGETSTLFRAEHGFRVCVAMAETRHAIRREMHVGKLVALHAGSSSKVLLAWDTDLAEEVLAGALPSITKNTVTSRAELAAELETIRQTGYSITDSEQDEGAAGVSVPVFDGLGALVGALGISGPSSRVSYEQCVAWADLLAAAAEQIGRTLSGQASA